MIHLLWAIHNHQPVGNFDFVFERSFDRAYRPFLDVLKAHPGVGISLHCSGILLDWLEAHRPAYLREVRALCEEGRVEVLGGGYYEPILPMLTDADRRGQIRALSRRVRDLFGREPRGMWLAERVWEPSLVASIADAGIEYVLLDGSHFKLAGRSGAELDGWFQTEDQGRSLKLLPIHDEIRDYIPFRPVEEVVAALRALDTGGRVQVVFGDDGEKFGDWPETHQTVYGERWLDRFFSALEAEPETFAVRPVGEGFAPEKSLGLVYLPPASYHEMMAWAQNTADIPRMRSLKQSLRDSGRAEEAERFVHGSFWRNFLVKYPESNRIHKQALRLSAEVERAELDPSVAGVARDHVWQAQCNCGYWHGVFGGLYLPHLRFALYRHLIAAQKILDAGLPAGGHAWREADWNYDGRVERQLNTPFLLASFTAGGTIDQLWLKRTEINLCDTMTRRREAYHDSLDAGGSRSGSKLEDHLAAKEEGLRDALVYDRRLREDFCEWILPPETSFGSWRRQEFEPAAALRFGDPELLRTPAGVEVRFEGRAVLASGSLEVVKTYAIPLDRAGLEVRWELRAGSGGAVVRLVAESLFCLLAGDAPDRYLLWEDGGESRRDILASRGEMPGGTRVEIVDEWLGLRCAVSAPEASILWRDAIETVSQSEGGYERIYQGTVVAPVWDVRLRDGERAACVLRVEFEEGKGNAEQGT